MPPLPGPLRRWLRNRRRRRNAVEQNRWPALTPQEKRQHLVDWARRSGVRIFVETGTYRGETTLALRRVVDRCITIELDRALHDRAKEAFAGIDGIELLLGDSGELMSDVLAGIDQPALFWLDGHYSGQGTGRGAANSPILRELGRILEHRIKDHVVIIDDAREFLGEGGYPTIAALTRFARRHGRGITIRDDLIHIYARPEI